MINLRVAAAGTATFALLMIIWTKVAEKGYDKTAILLEEHNKKMADQQQQMKKLISEDMAGLGASGVDNAAEVPPNEFQEPFMRARQLRPLGTWMGVLKGDDKKMAFIKFEREKYWLWIKNPYGEDVKERGKYEYMFDSILFKPDGKPSYSLEYYMITKNGIQLAGYNYNYTLEREEDLEFDF